jgi:hypothetical protein
MNRSRIALVIIVLVIVTAFVFIIFGHNIVYEDLSYLFYSDSEVPSGMSYEHLITTYWDWWVNVPKATGGSSGITPIHLTKCGMKDFGKVVFLVDALQVANDTDYSCPLEEGKSLFFPLLTSEYDTGVENHENDTDQMLINATKQENSGDSATLKIDNKQVDPAYLNRLNRLSDFWNININESRNQYDAPTGSFRAVAYGNFVFLKPLDPGPHEIQITAGQTSRSPLAQGTPTQSSAATITYKINVTSPNKVTK